MPGRRKLKALRQLNRQLGWLGTAVDLLWLKLACLEGLLLQRKWRRRGHGRRPAD